MASRVFVGFSSEDKRYFDLMKAWKYNKNMDFDFIDLQIDKEINSNNEQYIKSILRNKITRSGTFIQIIGDNTKSKHKYVRWEAEVAIEKNCRLICVNLNGDRQMNETLTPPILKNKGAMFVPFNASIIQYALDNFQQKDDSNWYYKNHVYKDLGL
jgi:hypothetical protein